MAKLQLALYWAAACGGCDVAVLDLDERFLSVTEVADIVFWPIAMDTKLKHLEALPDGTIDVGLFSGGIRNSENREMAELLRAKSRILIALGSCAHLGGIPGLANLATRRQLLRTVYRDTLSTVNPDGRTPLSRTPRAAGDVELPELLPKVQALHHVVPVDYTIPGCPPAVDRLWEAVQAVSSSILPPRGAVLGASDKTLCDECPRARDETRISGFRSIATFEPDTDRCLLEQGVVCCGPATRAGCGAACVKVNMPCRGCYGPPPGVTDQGASLLSAVASAIEASEPEEIDRIVAQLEDPAGTFYRFALPVALLPGTRPEDAA